MASRKSNMPGAARFLIVGFNIARDIEMHDETYVRVLFMPIPKRRSPPRFADRRAEIFPAHRRVASASAPHDSRRANAATLYARRYLPTFARLLQ